MMTASTVSPTTLRRSSLAEKGGGADSGGRSNGRLRVLLVDDNSINLQVISRILKIHMGDCIQLIELAKNGIQALEMLSRRSFDLVLLDIDMPILNGLDTARRIRSSQEIIINAHVPIVAVTTNDTPEWKRSFARAGMNGCISKPVVPDILKRTLGQVIKTGYSPESLAVL
ncbi:CheY-like superfamily [Dichotomocladium elegans]|nr:CheY-like superfamily [Dichotomocladium elegans]